MFNNNTDREWEKLGKCDPYYGVLTDEQYRNENLTSENKEEFFKSGYMHVDKAIQKIEKHIDHSFTIQNALDFGCGVGRLVIPLSKYAKHVVGVDVSGSMLKEARKNCKDRSISNVSFVEADDTLSGLVGKFNFIHSYIVFQHIPLKRGYQIFENLLSYLEFGGVCVIHFTYTIDGNTIIKEFVSLLKNYIPFSRQFIDLVKGRDIFAPQMQINSYDLNRIFLTIQKFNINQIHAEFTDHRGSLGALIYFKKPDKG